MGVRTGDSRVEVSNPVPPGLSIICGGRGKSNFFLAFFSPSLPSYTKMFRFFFFKFEFYRLFTHFVRPRQDFDRYSRNRYIFYAIFNILMFVQDVGRIDPTVCLMYYYIYYIFIIMCIFCVMIHVPCAACTHIIGIVLLCRYVFLHACVILKVDDLGGTLSAILSTSDRYYTRHFTRGV